MWKFLEVPAVQGAIAGAVVTLIGTFLNNFINVKNTGKIIKSNKENIENTMKHNKENIEKEQKFKEKLEEKRFLREKLEVIADEIISYNLEVQVAERSRIVDEVDNVPKSYKKAFFLSQMYFPDLYEIIRRYELSIVARKTIKNENTGEYEPPYSRREEYDNFLEQISVEIEKINEM